MKETLILTIATPATIPCPDGHEIRILSVIGELSGGPTAGGSQSLTFSRAGEVFFRSTGPQQGDNTATVGWMIGGISVPPMIDTIDVVTGAVTLSFADDQRTQGSLPDMWLPFSFVLSVDLIGGAIASTVTILYQRRHLSAPARERARA
jgi:hypothetical protein